jgi:putative transcriptional regulator
VALRVVRVVLMGVAVLLPAAGARGADPDLGRLRPGVFLYAAPKLPDPNFAETVVLLVQHGPEGAMGLVIDRPTDVSAREVLKEAKGLRELPVYWGGPVQPEAVFGLVNTDRPSKKAVRVFEDVYLTGRRQDLEAAARGAKAEDRVRIYLGYSGWGAGQLEGEVRRRGWLIAPGEAALVFSPEPEKLWRRAYRLLDRLEARFGATSLPVARWAFRE